ncbi:MAG: hypothetical protein JJT95_06175 [Pararhodobacter sp.]|nr:hypothetical protein [Pararhodobacter sp.]
MNGLMRTLFRVLRLFGDARAIGRGRGGQRLLRRGAMRMARRNMRGPRH